MPWETRKGRGRYYTRSRKENGRVMREYIGLGELAEAIAILDLVEREERAQEAYLRKAEREEAAALEAALDALCGLTDAAAVYCLEAAGYHRHNRGEWRKRRER